MHCRLVAKVPGTKLQTFVAKRKRLRDTWSKNISSTAGCIVSTWYVSAMWYGCTWCSYTVPVAIISCLWNAHKLHGNVGVKRLPREMVIMIFEYNIYIYNIMMIICIRILYILNSGSFAGCFPSRCSEQWPWRSVPLDQFTLAKNLLRGPIRQQHSHQDLTQ